jgi:hypothetical protein
MCACCVQATRGSVLYFVIADMAMVDSMYQYSLPAFTRLYNLRMDRSKKSEVTCVMRPPPPSGRIGAVVGDDCRPSVLRASVRIGRLWLRVATVMSRICSILDSHSLSLPLLPACDCCFVLFRSLRSACST